MSGRNFGRKFVEFNTFYEFNHIKCACLIIKISSDGIVMSIKGYLTIGDIINVNIGNENITVSVVYVDGGNIKLRYKDITKSQIDYILYYASGIP